MDNWFFEFKLEGENGTVFELKIPSFPEGESFDRWVRCELRFIAQGLSYISAISLEYSDICGLADTMSKIEPNKHLLWQTIEDHLSADIKVSVLGSAVIIFEIKNQFGPTRLLRLAIEAPFTSIQSISDKLNQQLYR